VVISVNPIYNINRFVLQEVEILLVGCLTISGGYSQEMMGLVFGRYNHLFNSCYTKLLIMMKLEMRLQMLLGMQYPMSSCFLLQY